MIYYKAEINAVFESCLEAIAFSESPTADQKCPHCGLIARYPIVVRESDRRMFEKLMESAYAVLDRHNITAYLLSEIKTECAIAIAKTKATGDEA